MTSPSPSEDTITPKNSETSTAPSRKRRSPRSTRASREELRAQIEHEAFIAVQRESARRARVHYSKRFYSRLGVALAASLSGLLTDNLYILIGLGLTTLIAVFWAGKEERNIELVDEMIATYAQHEAHD